MNVDNTDLTVLLPTVQEVLAEADLEDVRHPEVGLHQGPVGHPAVAGDGVEVEVAVQVVPGPPHLSPGFSTAEVEDCSQELLHRQSDDVKNQLGHPKI